MTQESDIEETPLRIEIVRDRKNSYSMKVTLDNLELEGKEFVFDEMLGTVAVVALTARSPYLMTKEQRARYDAHIAEARARNPITQDQSK